MFAELGDKQLYRYYFLSSGWNFEHSPCVVNLLALLRIAEHLNVHVVGQVAPARILKNAEEQHLIIPEGLKAASDRWGLSAWVPVRYRSANGVSDGHRRYWNEAMALLTTSGLQNFTSELAA